MNTPDWLVNGHASPFKCWSCEGPTIITKNKKHFFQICLKCNPEKTIEEIIDGCLIICEMCYKEHAYDINNYSKCSCCRKIMCDECDTKNTLLTRHGLFCSQECLSKGKKQ